MKIQQVITTITLLVASIMLVATSCYAQEFNRLSQRGNIRQINQGGLVPIDSAAIKREQGLDYIIEIDGGISAKNAGEVFAAGAESLVAGSAVFGAPDPEAEIVNMLNA